MYADPSSTQNGQHESLAQKVRPLEAQIRHRAGPNAG